MTQPDTGQFRISGDTHNETDVAETMDRRLLQDIAEARSLQSMEQLYRRYQSKLIPFLQRMTKDPALTEEVYNDVMLTIWNKAESFRGQSKVSSWVFSIAYRACLKRLQRNGVYQKLKDLLSLGTETDQEAIHGDEAATFEYKDLVRKALDTLPTKQRIVVELAYFEGYSASEIADIADCPVNSVKTRLFYARKKLNSYISDQEGISGYDDTNSL